MDRHLHIAELRQRQAKIDKWIGPDEDYNGFTLGQIVSIDIRIGDLLERARKDKRRNKDEIYKIYRQELQRLIMTNERLRNGNTYQTAHEALCRALKMHM